MRLVVALLALHALTALRYPWENVSVPTTWLRPSADLVLILAVGVTMVQGFGFRRWIALAVALGVLFVPVYRFGVSVMPVFYGKDFVPWDDVLMVDGLVHLLTHRFAPAVRVLLLALAGAVGLGLGYGAYRAAAAVLRRSARASFALAILVLAQLLVAASWVDSTREMGRRGAVLGPSMLGELAADLGDFIGKRAWRTQERFAEGEAAALAEAEGLGSDLGALGGADVLVIFVESYGRVLLRPPTRDIVAGWLDDLSRQAAARGFATVSAFATPSIRGGHSSIAHAELLAGIRIESQRAFDLMLQSRIVPLSKQLAAAGYRTINVQPATYGEWPEGKAFFGFTENVFLEAFGYEGHRYHFGGIPDQLALDWVRRHELTREERVFMLYASLVSHAPFSMVPPYFDDWERVAAEREWRPAKVWPIDWTNYVGHPEVEAAYLEAIRYSLKTVGGFAAHLARPTLLIVLGDHQPPSVGHLTESDPSFDVPIHALSNELRLLAPFVEAGFVRGMVPPAELAPFPLERFVWRFRRWFAPEKRGR